MWVLSELQKLLNNNLLYSTLFRKQQDYNEWFKNICVLIRIATMRYAYLTGMRIKHSFYSFYLLNVSFYGWSFHYKFLWCIRTILIWCRRPTLASKISVHRRVKMAVVGSAETSGFNCIGHFRPRPNSLVNFNNNN